MPDWLWSPIKFVTLFARRVSDGQTVHYTEPGSLDVVFSDHTLLERHVHIDI